MRTQEAGGGPLQEVVHRAHRVRRDVILRIVPGCHTRCVESSLSSSTGMLSALHIVCYLQVQVLGPLANLHRHGPAAVGMCARPALPVGTRAQLSTDRLN